MRIKRANFRFNRLVNVDDIIGHSNLLLMEQEDINVDNNVHDCILEDNANIMVLQNDIEPIKMKGIAILNNHKSFLYCRTTHNFSIIFTFSINGSPSLPLSSNKSPVTK